MRIVLACAIALSLAAAAFGEEWQLVYEDDFERAEPGPAWVMIGNYDAKLLIEDGELVGDGSGVIAFAYPVRGDQKVIFTGRWLPDTGRSATQFGGLLKCSNFYGFLSGVGLIHGRSRNTTNSLEFLGWSGRITRNKGPLPEPGKEYTFEYAVEGKHAWMKRDGEMILEGELPFVLEGPPFDRIMLYANEKRIRFDSVKIYRKGQDAVPTRSLYLLPTVADSNGLLKYAGDDPDGKVAHVVALMHAGKNEKAIVAAEAIAQPQQKLDALMMLAQNMTFDPYLDVIKAVAAHIKAHPELEPDQPQDGALTLAEASDMAVKTLMPRASYTVGYTNYLYHRLDDRHPFYDGLLFNYARAMLTGEGGVNPETKKAEGMRIIQQLYLRDMTNELVRMYMGERVPWGDAYVVRDTDAPRWACVLRETHARLLHVIEWWVTNRQREDGQLGGGWGDDVEVLRAWAPILICSDANQIGREGMRKIVDGAWLKAEGGLELGYSKKTWDVEHSAEPSADTQPLMLMFKPDDPTYVERNMKLLPLTRDLWTKHSPQGHRMFISAYMSALEVDPGKDTRANVPYHTRALKGLTWLMWHGDYPEVEKVWLEIADGWADAVLREEDGKLRGIVPAATDVADGSLGSGGGTWFRPALNWSYYNWIELNTVRIFSLLTAAYLKTGDVKYMEPIFASLEQTLKYEPRDGYIPQEPESGSDAPPSADFQRYTMHQWQRQGLFVPYLRAYQLHSGDKRFDDYFASIVDDPMLDSVARYQITGDVTSLIDSLDASVEEHLRYNLPMWTSQMDRVDNLKRLPGKSTFYSLTTGALTSWGDSFWPTQVVTFSHPNTAWAALTRRVSKDGVDVHFYNFDEDDDNFGLQLWNLPHGNYTVSINGKQTQIINLTQRAQRVDLTLPAGEAYDIKIRRSP